MKNYITRPLISKPGIQRDGTPFASQSYIDGQWCRFYMGRPRKIGGYKLIDTGNTEIIRSIFAVPKPNSIDAYLGRASSIKYNTFDFNGNGSGEIDRTPAGYLPANPNNVWDMDLFTTNKNTSISSRIINRYIVASAIPNGDDISNTDEGNIYWGNTDPLAPDYNLQLTQIMGSDGNPITASGGVVFLAPVMVAYGNDGFIQWSNKDDVKSNWDLTFNVIIDNTKVIQMYRYKGGLIAWTLGSIISLAYSTNSDGDPDFSYSTIQDDISVMSPQSIIQYNQQFFWVGIDQFYLYNGIVQRLDNSMSSDYFFQNINLEQRTKVWGMAVPRFKELWWFYPRNIPGQSPQKECNACIIYNTELNVWYDSMISRASGLSPGIFPFPLMADSQIQTIPYGIESNYGIWMHEFGSDQVISDIPYAIDSYFETHIMSLFENNPENNRLLRIRRIEPDFAQEGQMTVTVNNRMFPSDSLENEQLIQTDAFLFGGNTQKIDDVSSQGRLVSFVFDSNEVGGTYQAGQTLLDYEIGDVKPGSNS